MRNTKLSPHKLTQTVTKKAQKAKFRLNPFSATILLMLGTTGAANADNPEQEWAITASLSPNGSKLEANSSGTLVKQNGTTFTINNDQNHGSAVFNTFSEFRLREGYKAELRSSKSDVKTFVNLVNNASGYKTQINGNLTSYINNNNEEGRGNVIFADPNGIVVGASGVVNVGSLTMTVPNHQDMQDLISQANNKTLSEDKAKTLVSELISGKYVNKQTSETKDNNIKVEGTINSRYSVNIFAARDVIIGENASIIAGKIFESTVNTTAPQPVDAAQGADTSQPVNTSQPVDASQGADTSQLVNTSSGTDASQGGGVSSGDAPQSTASQPDTSKPKLGITADLIVATDGKLAGDPGNQILIRASHAITVEAASEVKSDAPEVKADAPEVKADAPEVKADAKDKQATLKVFTADKAWKEQHKKDAIPSIIYNPGAITLIVDNTASATVDAVIAATENPDPKKPDSLNEVSISLGKNTKLTAEGGNINLLALNAIKQTTGTASANSSITVKGALTASDIHIQALSSAEISPSSSTLDSMKSQLNPEQFKELVHKLGLENADADTKDKGIKQSLYNSMHSLYDKAQNTTEELANLQNFNLNIGELLPFAKAAKTTSTATIDIAASAKLNATNDLTIQARADRVIDASSGALKGLSEKFKDMLPLMPAVTYGKLAGESTVHIASKAQLTSGANTDITALSNNNLKVEATASNEKDKSLGFAFSLAMSDFKNQILVDEGAVLHAGGNINLSAITEQTIENNAEFKATGESAFGGPALALSLLSSTTKTQLDGNVTAAKNLNVSAVNLVYGQKNNANVAAGAEDKKDDNGKEEGKAEPKEGTPSPEALEKLPMKEALEKSPMESVLTWINGKMDTGGSDGDSSLESAKEIFSNPSAGAGEGAGSGGSKFRAAATVSVSVTKNDAIAIIGSKNRSTPIIKPEKPGEPDNRQTIIITGDLSLLAQQNQDSWHNSAISSVSAKDGDESKIAAGVAISYAQLDQHTNSIIGDNVVIKARRFGGNAFNSQTLDLSYLNDLFKSLKETYKSGNKMDINDMEVALKNIDSWSSIADVIKQLEKIKNLAEGHLDEALQSITGNYANASVTGNDKVDGLNLAGNVVVTNNDISSHLWLGDNTEITLASKDPKWSTTPFAALKPEPTEATEATEQSTLEKVIQLIKGKSDEQKQDKERREQLTTLSEMKWEWDKALDLQSENTVEQINIAGNFIGQFVEAGDGSKTAVGANVNVMIDGNQSTIGIGQVKLNGIGDMNVSATQDEGKLINLASAGNAGGSTGGAGALVVNYIHSNAIAFIDKRAIIHADTLDLNATHDMGLWSAAGSFGIGENNGIGASFVLNMLNTDIRAFVGSLTANPDDNSIRLNLPDLPDFTKPGGFTQDGSWNVTNLNVSAESFGQSGAFTIAGGLAKSSSGESEETGSKSMPSEMSKQMASLEGEIDKNEGKVDTSFDNMSKTDIPDKVTGAKEQITGISGSRSKKKKENKLSLAGSVSINQTAQKTRAWVDGITLKPNDTGSTNANQVSNLSILALNNTHQYSASGGGALTLASSNKKSEKSSAAGMAVAFNDLGNTTTAELKNSTVNKAGDINVSAAQGGDQISMGLAIAIAQGGKKNNSAYTLSPSVSSSHNTTKALVEQSHIHGTTAEDKANNISVIAYDRTRQLIGGGDFALSLGGNKGGSKGGALALSVQESELEAHWLNSDADHFKNLSVHANSASKIIAAAAGLAVSTGEGDSKKSTGQGSVTIVVMNNKVNAIADSTPGTKNTLTGDNLQVRASSLKEGGSLEGTERQLDKKFAEKSENTSKDAVSFDTSIVTHNVDYSDVKVSGEIVENDNTDKDAPPVDNKGKATPIDAHDAKAVDLPDADMSGEYVLAVAGSVAAGKGSGYGLGLGVIYADSKYNATLNNINSISLKDSLKVSANNATEIYSIAAAVAGGDGTEAQGTGSLVFGRGDVQANVNLGKGDTLSADSLQLSALRSGQTFSLAGGVSASTKKSGYGAAFSVIDSEHKAHATLSGAGKVQDQHAITITHLTDIRAGQSERHLGLAASIAGGKDSGLGGTLSLNIISDDTSATVKNANISTGKLSINAQLPEAEKDKAIIKSLSAVIGAGGKTGGGLSVGVNLINAKRSALLDNVALTSKDDIDMNSAFHGEIWGLAASAAAGGKLGLAGSVLYNGIGGKDDTDISGSMVDENGKPLLFGEDGKPLKLVDENGEPLKIFKKNKEQPEQPEQPEQLELIDAATGKPGKLVGEDGKPIELLDKDGKPIKLFDKDKNVLEGDKLEQVLAQRRQNIQTLVRVRNSEINNSDSSSQINNLNLNANSGALKIYSLSGGIAGGGKAGIGAGISVNQISAKRLAEITGSTIKRVNHVSLSAAQEQKNVAIAIGGAVAGKFALGGSSATNTLDGKEQALIAGSTLHVGSLTLNSSGGKRYIWSLGGAIAGAGSVAIGLANTNNFITAERNAIVRDSTLTLNNDLNLLSGGDSDINSLAVGVSVAGTAAAGASVAYNEINGKEQTTLDDVTITKVKNIKLDVTTGAANIKTLAGNVTGSGTGAGAGAAAISTIGQQRSAIINNSIIHADADTGNIEMLATTSGEIKTLSASGSGSGSGALALSNSTNNITSKTWAQITNSDGTAHNVTAKALNDSTINALSGSVAGAGGGAAGVASALDNIDSDTKATVSGYKRIVHDGVTRRGWEVTNLLLDAGTKNTIDTTAISAAVAGVVAAGATISLNNISSKTEAGIYDQARVLAQHNVAVNAHNYDHILGQNGALSISGTVTLSGIASVNRLNSTTIASIGSRHSDDAQSAESQADVTALGLGGDDQLTIDNGKIINGETNGEFQTISAPENKDGVDNNLVKTSYNPYKVWTMGTQEISGLAVQASSVQSLAQMAASVAIAINPGLAGSALGSNGVISGSTVASIKDANINQENKERAGTAQNVSVNAVSHMLGSGYLASAAASTGLSVAGVLDSLTFTNKTQALVSNSTLNSKGSTKVHANATQQVMSLLAGFSAGAVGGAANVSLIELKSATLAALTHSKALNVGSLSVNASASQQITPIDATLTVGGVAAGGNIVVLNNDSDTGAELSGNGQDGAQLTSEGSVSVRAENNATINPTVAGASFGGVAVAGSALIVHQNTNTHADLKDAKLTVNNDKLEVYAHDNVINDAFIGSVSGGAVGAGASANVLIANSLASAKIADSNILMKNGDVTVTALRDGDISLKTVAGSAGALAFGGSVGFLQLGEGATDLQDDEGKTYNPKSDLDKDDKGTLTTAKKLTASNRVQAKDLKRWDSEKGDWVADTENTGTINNINQKAVNSTSKQSAKVHETSAAISGGSITASNNQISVESLDQLSTSNLAGTAVVGAVSVGAAVATTYSNAVVTATVTPATLKAQRLEVKAISQDKEGSKGVTAHAISGSDGFVGIGAGVGAVTLNNQLKTELGGNIVLTGDLEVQTIDKQSLDVQAKGRQTGAAVAGLVLGIADHRSNVKTQINSNAHIQANNIHMQSLSAAPVTLNGQGSSGGALAGGNAAILVAKDSSKAQLNAANDATVQANRTLELTSRVTPYLHAYSQGMALAGAIAGGAVLVNTDLYAESSVSLADNVHLLAHKATISSQVAKDDSRTETLHTEGYAVAAAGLAAGNAVILTSKSAAKSQLTTGNNNTFEGLLTKDDVTNKDNSTWHFYSENNAIQTAKTEGNTGGLLAGGAYSAKLQQTGQTSTDVKGKFTGIINDLQVTASSDTSSRADVTAGQGGAVSGMLSKATTEDNSTTTASLYAIGENGGLAKLGDTLLKADHSVGLNSFVDSTNASLLGASGAYAGNTFNATTTTTLANDSKLEARSYTQQAKTHIKKAWDDKFNINSGSGGLANGAAGESNSTVTMNTASNIGSNVSVQVVGDGGWNLNPQDLIVQAFNQVSASDKVKLKSGGAVALAKVISNFIVRQANASVTVNDSAHLESARDLILAASGLFNVNTSAASSTYGFAGAAAGESHSRIKADYRVSLADNTKLFSYRDTKLNAGFDSNTEENKGEIHATTDLWNKTAIPINGKPIGDATYDRNSHVQMAQTARVDSVQDIYIRSGKGIAGLHGEGNGTDLYKELLDKLGVATKIHTVSNTDTGSATVQLDGVLNSGAYHKQGITFDSIGYYSNGKEISYDRMADLLAEISNIADENERVKKTNEYNLTYGIKATQQSESDPQILKPAIIHYRNEADVYASLIEERIKELHNSINTYGIDLGSKLAFEGELEVLENAKQKLIEQAGFAKADPDDKNAPKEGVNLLNDISVQQVFIDPIIASSGNIHIIADPVIADSVNEKDLVPEKRSYGTGKLYAPADSSITIKNTSAAVLRIQDLLIPDHHGGQVLLNNIKVSKTSNGFGNFAEFKDDATSSESKIEIASTYSLPSDNRLHQVIPDLFLDGNVSNSNGELKVNNAQGSIYASGEVRALKVDLSAGSNFILDNKRTAFQHTVEPAFQIITDLSTQKISTDPETLTGNDKKLDFDQTIKIQGKQRQALLGKDGAKGKYKLADSPGFIAGQSMIIHAQYLNINGTLQSGIDKWTLNIGGKGDDVAKLIEDIKISSAEQIKTHTYNGENITPGEGSDSNLIRIQTQKVSEGRLGFSYDTVKNELVVDPVHSGGGYMELTGKIFSTGGGKIKVLNGFNSVDINNQTSLKLNVTGIDLGKGAVGHLRINDVTPDAKNPNKVTVTEYQYDGKNTRKRVGVLGMTDTTKNTFKKDIKDMPFNSEDNDSNSTTFNPTPGRTYVGLTGTDITGKTEYREVYNYKYIFKAKERRYIGSYTTEEVVTGTTPTKLDSDRYLTDDHDAYQQVEGFEAGYVNVTMQRYENKEPVIKKKAELPYHCRHSVLWICWDTDRQAIIPVTKETGTTEIVKYSVRADFPVSVEFTGQKQGTVNVNSNGNLLVSGAIYNDTGNTSLTSKGNITQNAGAVITSKNLTLSSDGTGNLGDASQALVINVSDNLSAHASHGNINLENRHAKENSVTNLLRLDAGGDITLKTQNNVTTAPDVVIAGNAITLISEQGSLGSASNPLTFRMAEANAQADKKTSSHYLLTASGTTGVYLQQDTHLPNPGDIWVNTIEAANGDVQLTVQKGLFDGSKVVTFDQRGIDQLNALWDSMGLKGEQAENDLAAQEQALVSVHNAQYQRYWKERGNKPFDAQTAQLTNEEITQLQQSGWTQAQIDSENQWRLEIGQQDYNEHYSYELSDADKQTLASTASWTPEELETTFANQLSSRGNRISSEIKKSNITGNNIYLRASNVGTMDGDIIIDLSKGKNLTDREKAALLSAQPDDIVIDLSKGKNLPDSEKSAQLSVQPDDITEIDAQTKKVTVTVRQRTSVNVEQKLKDGSLDIISSGTDNTGGTLFLNSQKGVTVKNLRGGYVELVTDTGGIQATNPTQAYNIIASKQLSLIANGGGDIGSAEHWLTTNLQNNGLLHVDGHQVYIKQDGSVRVNRLIGTDTLNLNIQGDLTSVAQNTGEKQNTGENLLGGNVNLVVEGNAGSADKLLQIGTGEGNNPELNRITLNISKNAWLGGQQGKESQNGILRISEAKVGGALVIGQLRDLQQSGKWHIGSLQLTADNDWIMQQGSSLTTTINEAQTSTGNIIATLGGNWEMTPGTTINAAGELKAIVTGNALLDSLRATQANIQSASLQATKKDMLWQVDNLLQLTTTGGDLGSAEHQPLLQASTIKLDAQGQIFASLQPGFTSGEVQAVNNIVLNSLGDNQLTSIHSDQGTLDLHAISQLTVADIDAPGRITLSGDNLTVTNVMHTLADIVTGSPLSGHLSLAKAQADNMRAQADQLTLGTANIVHDLTLQSVHDMQLTQATSGNAMSLHSTEGSIRFGKKATADESAEELKVNALSAASLTIVADLGDVIGGNAITTAQHMRIKANNLHFGKLESQLDLDLKSLGDGDQGQGNIYGLAAIAGNNLSMEANGAIQIDGVQHGGTYTLKSGKDLTLIGGKTLMVQGDVQAERDMKLVSSDELTLDDVNAGRNIRLASNKQLDIGAINGGGVIELNAHSGNILLHKDAVSTASAGMGDVTISGNDADVQNISTSGGNISATVNNWQGKDLHASAEINLQAQKEILLINSISGGDQQMQAAGNIQAQQIKAGGSADFTSGGAMNLATVNAGDHVQFTASQLIQLSGDLIAGGFINLLANGGNIDLAGNTESSASGDITLRGNTIIARLIRAAGGNIAANGRQFTAADLYASRNIQLQTSGDIGTQNAVSGGEQQWQAGGDIQAQQVQAGGNATLVSTGEMQLANLESGDNISLRAGRSIQVQLCSNSGGEQQWQAGGDIQAQQVQAGGNATLASTGAMQLANLDSGGNISLQAGGQILVQHRSRSNGGQQWRADQGIEVDDLQAQGQIFMDSLLNTRIKSLQTQSQATINAGWRNNVATDGSIYLQQLQADEVNLAAGNKIQVDKARSGKNLHLAAQTVDFNGQYDGADDWQLWITGTGEPSARNLSMQLSAPQITFNQLNVTESDINTNTADFHIKEATHVDLLKMHTPGGFLFMNNVSPEYKDGADVQFYQTSKTFWLQQNGKATTTNARVIHRNSDNQILETNATQYSEAVRQQADKFDQNNATAHYVEQQLASVFVNMNTPLSVLAPESAFAQSRLRLTPAALELTAEVSNALLTSFTPEHSLTQMITALTNQQLHQSEQFFMQNVQLNPTVQLNSTTPLNPTAPQHQPSLMDQTVPLPVPGSALPVPVSALPEQDKQINGQQDNADQDDQQQTGDDQSTSQNDWIL